MRARQQAVDMLWALQGRMAPGGGGLEGLGKSWEPRGTERGGVRLSSVPDGRRRSHAALRCCLRTLQGAVAPHTRYSSSIPDPDQRVRWKVPIPCNRTSADVRVGGG